MDRAHPEAAASSAESNMSEPIILGQTDLVWLKTYGIEPTSDWLDECNQLVDMGSMDLRSREGAAAREQVVAARAGFLGALGIDKYPSVESWVKKRPAHVSPSTFIATQRALADRDINAAHTTLKCPGITDKGASVTNQLDAIDELGLNVAPVVEAYPNLLNKTSATIRHNFGSLQSRLHDAVAPVHAHPPLMGYAPESIGNKIETMQEFVLDAEDIIEIFPAVSGSSEETIRIKMYALMQSNLYDPYTPSGQKRREIANNPFNDAAFVKSFFRLPTESLLGYLAATPEYPKKELKQLPMRARRWAATHLGKNTPERTAAYLDMYPEIREKIGHIATMNLFRLKLPPTTISKLVTETTLHQDSKLAIAS